ncbi:hypothetical protein K2173_012050 [Erythroxylum novogranatense]|uniref:Pectinesterase inhibitor domain-containing protein n=1 Tax=Erythroxylum novogranatense TaxID=1862640 RepID=A0AAV8TGF2_9ROSI|nr:hypothetical protein K2173_012050 [Erythroxylum novogranatense]
MAADSISKAMTGLAMSFSIFKCILFIVCPLLLSVVSSQTQAPETEIRFACNASQYPEICRSSLIQSNNVPSNPTPVQIIQSAMWVSSQNINTARSMLQSLLGSSQNQNLTNAANSSLEYLRFSEYRISLSNDSLARGEIKDVRAWMSAALTYQSGCHGGFQSRAGDIPSAKETILHLQNLMNITSNALSMVVAYDLYGNETRSWRPPQTEHDGFWEKPGVDGGMEFKGGVPSNLTPSVTVCKDGTNGCYKTVQEAVNAAPDNKTDSKFVISIKEGVYDETVRVPIHKKNVVFLGDGIGKTVITGSLDAGQPGITTFESATVGVLGDGFMAKGLTIQNTAGPPTHQAVALRIDSDLSVLENCEFLSNQDTLYANSLRQYYKSCRIVGNVDFIFGNSAATFQDCQILVKPRQENPEKGDSNAITAHGRSDPAQSTGYVFHNCSINGTEEYMGLYKTNPSVHKTYLGRPWKEYSRVVFIKCNMEVLVSPEGWSPWSGDFALKTLYYGEFENSGPGSTPSNRVAWSSQIPADHVNAFSVGNFLQGNKWIPTSS